MSDIVNLVDSALDFQTQNVRGSRQANSSIQIVEVSPDQSTFATGSAISFQIPIASGNLVRSDPEITIRYTVTFGDNGTECKTDEATCLTALSNKAGCNSFPNNRCISSSTVKINGQVNMSSNPAQDVDAIAYMMSADELARLSSCSMPDNLHAYAATANTNVLRTASDDRDTARGLGAGRIISTALAGSVLTVVYEVTEKLLCRPFQWHQPNPKAFVGISDMTVNLNLASNFALAAFANALTNVPSCTATINNMWLRIHQFTPQANLGYSIPKTCYWNSPVIEHTIVNYNTLVAGAATAPSTGAAVATTNRSYSVVPKLYAVYVKDATRSSFNVPERLYPISNISVNSGIKKNLLRNLSQEDLYHISKKNGYNGSRAQFTGGYSTQAGTGCVLYFSPGDLDSDLFHQSNVESNHVFNCEVTVSNYSASATTPQIHVVTFSDAILTFNNGQWSEEMASIRPSELASAKDMYQDLKVENKVLGGSIWSWMNDHVLKPAVRFGRRSLSGSIPIIGPVASSLLSDRGAIGSHLNKAGYGKKRKTPKRKKAGSVINLGGKKLSNAQLLKLLD